MDKLKNYKSVGWDLDHTLFNHPNTEKFADYIRENPHNQQFHIVTFRTHNLVPRIEPELHKIGLTLADFDSVQHPKDSDYERYEDALYANPKRRQHLDAIEQWQHFKGAACKKTGCGVLIDDMTNDVLPGCEKHGIDHFHPDEF
jgi:hypothetical protein